MSHLTSTNAEDQAELKAGRSVLRVLNSSGDTRTVYDPTVDKELVRVSKLFDEAIGKGLRAFRVDEDGGGGLITELPHTASKVVLTPGLVGG